MSLCSRKRLILENAAQATFRSLPSRNLESGTQTKRSLWVTLQPSDFPPCWFSDDLLLPAPCALVPISCLRYRPLVLLDSSGGAPRAAAVSSVHSHLGAEAMEDDVMHFYFHSSGRPTFRTLFSTTFKSCQRFSTWIQNKSDLDKPWFAAPLTFLMVSVHS